MAMFKPGDIVRLKSSGPKMTIVEEALGKYACTRFDGENRKVDLFSGDILEKVSLKEKVSIMAL